MKYSHTNNTGKETWTYDEGYDECGHMMKTKNETGESCLLPDKDRINPQEQDKDTLIRLN